MQGTNQYARFRPQLKRQRRVQVEQCQVLNGSRIAMRDLWGRSRVQGLHGGSQRLHSPEKRKTTFWDPSAGMEEQALTLPR
jgi:hypothetical protein